MASPEAVSQPKTAIEWLQVIEESDRTFEKWRRRVRKIIKVYTEQRRDNDTSKRKYAMLWSNISTLQPVVYARVPQPVVIRRFKDKDRVARNAGEMVERALVYTIEKTEFDGMMRNIRDDYLLGGRGSNWVRYEADLEPMAPETSEVEPDAMNPAEPAEQIANERVVCDYVNWADFGHTIARRWEEVTAVWRRVFMDRAALVDRFGAKIGNAVPLNHKPDNSDPNSTDRKNKGIVFEIWDKTSGKCIWVAKDFPQVLDVRPPLLNLEGFFPCPKPAYATTVTDSLIPIPDYVYYQDQAEQIDTLTARIDKLSDSLKLVGFYPAGTEGTSAIIKAMNPDNTDMLIPIVGWSAFSEKGGSAAQINWIPVDMVMKVIQGCQEVKASLIQNVYEITGMSDIVRGASNPNETATAQQIKNQWGSIRVRDRQAEIQRFARDTIRIMAEVIADKFQAETLQTMTGFKFPTDMELAQQQQLKQLQLQQAMMGHNGGPPMDGMSPQAASSDAPPPQGGPIQAPPQMAPPAAAPQPIPPQAMPQQAPPELESPEDASVTIDQIIQLLRDDKLRCYRLDIESDSTIVPDEQADKEAWNELLGEVSNFMTNAMPIGQAIPEMVPVLGEMLLSTIRKYRAGKSLEDAVESAMGQLSAKSKESQNQPPPPDPNMMKVQQQGEIDKAKLQQDGAKAQAEAASKQQQMQNDHVINQQKIASDHKLAQDKAAADERKIMREHELKIQLTNLEYDLKKAIAFEETKLKEKVALEPSRKEQSAKDEQNGKENQSRAEMAALTKAMLDVSKLLSMPKIITTPDGRTYTSQSKGLQ